VADDRRRPSRAPTGIVVERERSTSSATAAGRDVKTEARSLGKNYGRVVFEALKGGLDFP